MTNVNLDDHLISTAAEMLDHTKAHLAALRINAISKLSSTPDDSHDRMLFTMQAEFAADVETWLLSAQITPSTAPNIPQIVQHVTESGARLAAELEGDPEPSDFLRGYVSGAITAYDDILQALGAAGE